MKHRKEKKHLNKCFDVRIAAYLKSPGIDYVKCPRCEAYMWLDVPKLQEAL
jgi:hypothetical protein